jgi:hypothetical protein
MEELRCTILTYSPKNLVKDETTISKYTRLAKPCILFRRDLAYNADVLTSEIISKALKMPIKLFPHQET